MKQMAKLGDREWALNLKFVFLKELGLDHLSTAEIEKSRKGRRKNWPSHFGDPLAPYFSFFPQDLLKQKLHP